mgnify:CR=1 FL=1
MIRLASRLDNYISFLLQYDAGTHDSIRGQPFRQLSLVPSVREQLMAAHDELHTVLRGELRSLLISWYNKLSRELDGADEADKNEFLDESTRYMCTVHAHLVLLLRNVTAAEMTEPFATSIVCGMAFLATRHQWNLDLLDDWDGVPSYDAWRVPETELYEAMQVLRRSLVLWMRDKATQPQLDAVMTAAVRISEGSGGLIPPAGEIPQRWGYLAGQSNRGRFTVFATRSRRPPKGVAESVQTLLKEPDEAMVVDVQVMQLTLMASHPQALRSAVAEMDDVEEMFGDVAMQACLTDRSAHREVYRLVGRLHSIAYWDIDEKMPLLEMWRAYYPQELFPSEKSWLPAVLEPVRQTYMMLPQPLQLFLPDSPLPDDAQVAYLVGKQPSQAGVWIEIFVYRARRMVQVYQLESHGRRHYRSLIYTSDARHCLREMQPSISHRSAPWPAWGRYEAGHPYDVKDPGSSAVITREATVSENLSFGEETFMPARLLYGLLPATLLERYTFWQDEADYLRGYPKDTTKSHDVIFVNLGVGGHVAFHGSRFAQVGRGEAQLAPARAVVLRLQKARLARQRKAVNDGLSILDEFIKGHALLSQPFESSFALCGGMVKLLRRLGGGHSFGAGTEPTVARDLETIRRLLPLVSLVPFQRRRKRHRIPKIVVPALLDALTGVIEAEESGSAADTAAKRAASSSRSAASAMSASDFDEEELVLLDLLHAPPDSYLYSLATVLTRIENLSHVLAWAKYDDADQLGHPAALAHSDLRIVSLPRLKLTFQARASPPHFSRASPPRFPHPN